MVKRVLFELVMLLSLATSASAQAVAQATIPWVTQQTDSATSTTLSSDSSFEVTVTGQASLGAEVSVPVAFEGAWILEGFQGGTWVSIRGVSGEGQGQEFSSAAGILDGFTFTGIVSTPGWEKIRIRVYDYVSGSLVVRMRLSGYPSGVGPGLVYVTGAPIVRITDTSLQAIETVASAPVGTERGVVVRNIPSGAQSVTQGTSPWVISGTASVTQVTSPWVISGTVAATQSGVWSVSFTAPQAVTQSGTWNITDINGTVSLPTGASTLAEQQTQTTALQIIDNLPLAQGSTTAGQTGPLVQGAVTTIAPTYVTGQTSPISLTTLGSVRYDLHSVGGTQVTQSVPGIPVVSIADSLGALIVSGFNGLNSNGPGVLPMVAQFDDTAPTAITENRFGNVRMSANRNLFGTIRDAAGNERGVNVTAGNALSGDVTSIAGTAASTGVGASGAGTQRVAALIHDGTDTAQVTTTAGGSLQVECAAGCGSTATTNFVTISSNESVAAPTAAVWYIKRQWALPASAHATPIRAWSAVTTAASRTMVLVANNLGNLNLSTNTFTAANSVASPYHYSRLFGCVTTVMSATADTITPTYTDELGNSQAATGVAFASASPVGNCYEFPLATASGPTLDSGVRAVTAASDSAAPTGVVTFYGVNPLHDALGVANTKEDTSSAASSELNANEQILLLQMQAATTAQQRGVGVVISIR